MSDKYIVYGYCNTARMLASASILHIDEADGAAIGSNWQVRGVFPSLAEAKVDAADFIRELVADGYRLGYENAPVF